VFGANLGYDIAQLSFPPDRGDCVVFEDEDSLSSVGSRAEIEATPVIPGCFAVNVGVLESVPFVQGSLDDLRETSGPVSVEIPIIG
jgi:hypothetical protein